MVRRRIRWGILMAAFLVFSLSTAALASISVVYNDTALRLVAPPAIVEGRVMVPLESLAEPLGFSVVLDRQTDVFTISSPRGEFTGQVGSTKLVGQARVVATGTAPQMIDGHMYVPVQAIVNLLGIRLAWDGGAKSLKLRGPVPDQPGSFLIRDAVAPREDEPTGAQVADEVGGQENVSEPVSESDGDGAEKVQAFPQAPSSTAEGHLGWPDFPMPLSQVEQVSFIRDNAKARLEINVDQFSGLSINLLQSPPRLVIDIPRSQLVVEYETLEVEDPVVRSVRMSQYQSDMVRVVVDLRWMTGYEVKWETEQKVVIYLNQLLGGVRLTRMGSALSLFFEATGEIPYELRSLREPDRLVIDFAGATLRGEGVEARIADEMVEAIRFSQFQRDKVRFVMETKAAIDAERLERKPSADGLQLLVPGLHGETGWLEAREVIYDGTGYLGDYVSDAADSARWEASPSEAFVIDVDSELLAEPDPADAVGSEDEVGQELVGQPAGELQEASEESTEATNADEADGVDLSDEALMAWLSQPEISVEAVGERLKGLDGKTIVIDPGHGGPEVGAAGREGVWEKDLNLAVAALVERGLTAAGAEVYMTRVADTLVSLAQRSDLANSKAADAFISIHFNASYSKQATGTETLYRDNHGDSALLGAAIQSRLYPVVGTVNRGIKVRDDLYILRHSQVPTALVEVGFLDHPEEGARFLTGDAQRRAAIGITAGIHHFFELLEQVAQLEAESHAPPETDQLTEQEAVQ